MQEFSAATQGADKIAPHFHGAAMCYAGFLVSRAESIGTRMGAQFKFIMIVRTINSAYGESVDAVVEMDEQQQDARWELLHTSEGARSNRVSGIIFCESNGVIRKRRLGKEG